MGRNIEEIEKGYLLNDERNREKHDDLSFYTLKLAFSSYFSTYQAMRMNFNIYKEDRSFLESQEYISLYISTIIHFQHFFELFIKSILRDIDELLVIEGVKDPYILYKLIRKEAIEPNEDININSIGFTRTMEVYKKLKKHKLIEEKYHFLDEYKTEIKALNNLRNRILHRGLYVLPYKELDIFLVKRILPIIKEMQVLEDVKRNYKVWGGKDLTCGINVLESLCNEGKKETINHNNIALLKELGRTSYNNPLYLEKHGFGDIGEVLNRGIIQKYESIAMVDAKLEQISKVRNCPSCGLNTLVCYFDIEDEYEQIDGEQCLTGYFHVFTEARCTCCTFTINQFIDEDTLSSYVGENDIWSIEDVEQ